MKLQNLKIFEVLFCCKSVAWYFTRMANGTTWLGSEREESIYGGIPRQVLKFNFFFKFCIHVLSVLCEHWIAIYREKLFWRFYILRGRFSPINGWLIQKYDFRHSHLFQPTLSMDALHQVCLIYPKYNWAFGNFWFKIICHLY